SDPAAPLPPAFRAPDAAALPVLLRGGREARPRAGRVGGGRARRRRGRARDRCVPWPPLLPPAAPVRRLELLRAPALPARRRDRRGLPRRSGSEAARLHPVPDNRAGPGAGARPRRPPRPRGLSPLPSVLPPACLAGRQSSLIGVSRPHGQSPHGLQLGIAS